jgi:FtsP/CotA-like multicopper oxidase with cupredoxin domain
MTAATLPASTLLASTLPASTLPASTAASNAPDSSAAASPPPPPPPPPRPWVGSVVPSRTRKLIFSEEPVDPADPNGAMRFYLTVDGQTPKPFDPTSAKPNLVAHQGDVEDWIIENRSSELHAFHIHQVHFEIVEWLGVAVNEPFLRDTINVPYRTAGMAHYPTIKLRMDFRDPDAVGTFPYHCHLLDHEDAGMMGTIRVEAKSAQIR